MTRDHALVAGELLVVTELPNGRMQERVEPEDAAQRRGQCVGMQVAAEDMAAFVCKQ